MAWKRVLDEGALGAGEREVVEVQDHKILLIHHEGKIYAVLNSCPHMGSPMKRGKITEDDDIICPLHHSRFDLETGEVKEWAPWPPVVGKVLGAVKEKRPLPTYPTKVEDGGIWIQIGGEEA